MHHFCPLTGTEIEILLYVFLLDRSIHMLGTSLEETESPATSIKGVLSFMQSAERELASMMIKKG